MEMTDRILSAAGQRFFNTGLRATTVDDICSDLGISKKTLYRHFESKNALAAAVVERMTTGLKRSLDEIAGSCPEPIERFERIIMKVSSELTRLGGAFMDDVKKDVPEAWLALEEFREEEILLYIENILKEGISKGRVRKDLNTRLATLVYLGAVREVIQPEVLGSSPLTVQDAFKCIFSIFLKGIEKRRGEGT